MKMMPLRYSISSWRQLVDVKSNNDPRLKILIADFMHNNELRGFRISITHPDFGVLFSYVLDARGTFITQERYTHNRIPDLSNELLLKELERYGFYVVYRPEKDLQGSQISYLMNLQKLCFDKIRILNVWSIGEGDAKNYTSYVVGFQSDKLRDWLNMSYSPSIKDFKSALLDGTAINLTDISKTKRFDWSWLTYAANIDDIIRDNTRDNVYTTNGQGGDYDW